MAFELARVDRLQKTYDLASRFPNLTGPFTAATVALLPPRANPTSGTVWVAAGVTAGVATVLFAGPDASSTGAVVVTGSADLWLRVTVGAQTDAVKVERITLLGGGAVPAMPPTVVSSVNGASGAVTIASLPPSGGAGGALSGSYPDPGLKVTAVDTSVAARVNDPASQTAGALRAAYGWVDVANSSGDTAAIAAAITARTSGGKVNGEARTTPGKIARITEPTTISLGYSNTQAANWATDTTTEKVRLSLDILPDAGLGTALTIKGGYGVELDLNILGGGARGTVTDATTTIRTVTDAVITAGGTPGISTVSSATAAFTSADVGVPVEAPGAGSGGATLYGTISSVVDASTATVNFAVPATVSGGTFKIGSFTVASAAAIAAGLKPGAVVFIDGAGPAPEGVRQPLVASVRTVNAVAGTFTLSEGSHAAASGAAMNWFDVAVRLEDMVGCKLNIYGKGFQGYLLAADATNDATRRLRSCEFPSIVGNGCGGTMFWKSIEAFGSIGHIMSNTIFGDYYGQGADLHWDHWEGGVSQPTTQLARAYLWFDRYGQVNNLSVSVGDRATEAAVLMTGDSASNASMGRFAQVRATMYQAVGSGATITSGSNQVTNVVSSSLTFKVGQRIVGSGIPDGATITAVTGSGNGYTAGSPGTITMSAAATASASSQQVFGVTCDGLKMVGVSSVTITQLDTARSIAGLRIVGGGATGIKILNHKSPTSDVSPLIIEAGATGAPRVDVAADYRFILGYALDLGSGLLATSDIRFRGHVEGVHQAGGASGKYAARSASTVAVLDIAGLRQKAISGLAGFINPATVALKGRPAARLESGAPGKGTLYYADGAGDFTALPAGGSGQVPTWQADGSLAAGTPSGGGAAAGSYYDPATYTTLLAWTQDPVTCGQGTVAIVTGRPQYSVIPITSAIIATNLSVVLATAGSGTTWTSGQNFLALYDSTGALLGQTADISTLLASAAANAELKVALATPVAVSAGRVYAVCLFNWSAGTAPTLFGAKTLAGGTTNLGSSSSFPRSASDSVTRTAPVSSKAINLLSASQQSLMWAAIS